MLDVSMATSYRNLKFSAVGTLVAHTAFDVLVRFDGSTLTQLVFVFAVMRSTTSHYTFGIRKRIPKKEKSV